MVAVDEQLRQASEGRMTDRLAWDEERKALQAEVLELRATLERERDYAIVERSHFEDAKLHLSQVVTSLRWWAVFDLVWMCKEIIEPARFAWSFPGSWAYKLSVLTAHPYILMAWFLIAFCLVLPLVFALATVPGSRACRHLEGQACVGLFMGGVGYAFLSFAASRLDIPHLVDSYRGSTIMLIGTGLLVACWHNARIVRAHKQAAGGTCRELACGDSLV